MNTGIAKVIGIGREVLGRRHDGTTFPIDLSVSEVQTDGDRKFTGFVRDITARKQAEASLAEQAVLAAFSADIGRALVREGGLRTTLQRCTAAMVSHLDARLRTNLDAQ